jgi:hypothetical protein
LQKNLLGTFFPSIKSITNYFSEVNGWRKVAFLQS